MKKQPSVRRQRRIDGASERQALRDQRTPREQLNRLDQKLGVNMGARKERARLREQIPMIPKEA